MAVGRDRGLFLLWFLLVGTSAWLGRFLLGTPGLVIGGLLSLATLFAAHLVGDHLVLRASEAVPIAEGDAPELHELVERLAARVGTPTPRLELLRSAQPNVFVVARSHDRTTLCLTRGLFETLDREELEAVVAHELGRLATGRVPSATMAVGLATGVLMAVRLARWGSLTGDTRRRNTGPLAVLGMVAMVPLLPLAAVAVHVGCPPDQEFENDRATAALVGDGRSLARALAKLHAAARTTPHPTDPAMAALYLVDPLAGRPVDFLRWFPSHVPVAERIERLTVDAALAAPSNG